MAIFLREEEDRGLGGLMKEAVAEVLGVLGQCRRQKSRFWAVE